MRQTKRKTFSQLEELLQGRTRFNVLEMRPEVKQGDEWLPYRDTDYLLFPEGCGSKEVISDAISLLSRLEEYDPVQEYLGRVYLECKPFQESYSELILGVHESLYEVYLRKWFAGLVARRYAPGCKLDTVLVLLGAQGIGKSSFFRAVAGKWFTDSVSSGGGLERDDLLVFHRNWLVEWGELGRVLREDRVEQIKSFLSRQSDMFRAPYGRQVESYPRRFVVCASSNLSNCLYDPTGNRRFWILEVDRINLGDVLAHRDNLFADAMKSVLHGGQWWLTPEEQALSDQRNRSYLADDFLIALEIILRDTSEVTTATLIAALGMPRNRKSELQLAQSMRALGWTSRFKRDGDRVLRVWCKSQG